MEATAFPKLARSTPSNTYCDQIKHIVRSLIKNGHLPHGSYLPGENALANHLGVHRQTVRRAYGGLTDIIRPQQGYGWQVIP